MPLTPAQLAEMESQFLDSQFAPLDLSGCISSLQPPSEDAELPDPRFAPLDDRGRGLGSKGLKDDIERMVSDPEVQKELARAGNADALAALQQGEAQRVAIEFRQKHADYYRSDENWQALVQWLAVKYLAWEEAPPDEAQEELIQLGYFTTDNLNAAYRALTRAGSLETDPMAPRPLSVHQKRSIALQAANGQIDDAIARYLQQRLPEEVAFRLAETFDLEQIYDELSDPAWKSCVDEAAWFCWKNFRNDFRPTQERLDFMQSHLAGRIPTVTLLDTAWAVCQAAEKDAMRSAVLGQTSEPEQVAEPDLDRLSDEEIGALYHRTLRRMAEDAKQAR